MKRRASSRDAGRWNREGPSSRSGTPLFPRADRRTIGFTLVEMVIVLAILSIVAMVALPSIEPAQPIKLERAARELADAVRFARREAIRLSNPHGVDIDTASARLRVYRGDAIAMPPTPLYDVIHPITKKLYNVDLAGDPSIDGVTLAETAVWSSGCSQPDLIGFDADGRPRCGSAWSVLLETSQLTLVYAGHTRSITIDGETGRVTVQ